ncbi:unnamed protein product [Owenia fusiformis]|uniref:Glycosyltransferase n=1 Tax=Owenia fusiformis TaxID=6347 RepID=A0A8S4Q8C6_OWEFU|nr:unnamed protein product [Owenia fusiformis]
MYIINRFRGARGLKFGAFVLGLIGAFWWTTTANKNLMTIHVDNYNTETNKHIRDDCACSNITRKIAANTSGSHPTTSLTKSTKQNTEKTISTHITGYAKLKKLVETNKNIYKHDLQRKQFNEPYELKLKSVFSKTEYDKCSQVISESGLRHDVQYFVFQYNYNPSPIDVTLLSHLTLERGIHRIEKILAQWPGPASLSVFGTDDEIQNFLNTTHSWKRNNIGIHVVYQRNATYYPVNFMRNVAIYGANTSHIWMIDADFTPNKDAYQLIKKYIFRFDWTGTKRPALITPAFETALNEGGVPDNRTQLLKKLEDNSTLVTFSFTRCPNCHINTNWEQFMIATEEYKVKGGGNFEPYLVLQRNNSPIYDERLIARHWNKILYDYELFVLHYEFNVLPDVFIVHEPHERIKQPKVEFMCLEKIGRLIKDELNKKRIFLQQSIATHRQVHKAH